MSSGSPPPMWQGRGVTKPILLLPLILLSLGLGACTPSGSVPAAPESSAASVPASSAPAPGGGAACTYTATWDASKPVELPPASGG